METEVPLKLKLDDVLKAGGIEAGQATNENGEAELDAAEGAAPKPVDGKEPNGVAAVAPNVVTDDFGVISPNAVVEDDV